jgi:transcriptional regulatory protein LevR
MVVENSVAALIVDEEIEEVGPQLQDVVVPQEVIAAVAGTTQTIYNVKFVSSMDTLLTGVGTDLMKIIFMNKGAQLQPRQALTRLT